MTTMKRILILAGPTASGKSSRAVEEALSRGLPAAPGRPAQAGGEVISVDSRQVYRGLDIGTEKITKEEMRSVPHHLIDIREPSEKYSAGDFVSDAARLIDEITARGKLPILAGGTHYYFDALLHGLPLGIEENPILREELEKLPDEELYARVQAADPRRARELDPKNRRRLIRALEIVDALGSVPERIPAASSGHPQFHATARSWGYSPPGPYEVEWVVLDPPMEELRERIDARLKSAFERGLVDEVRCVRAQLGDARLKELGLEYKIVGEYLRGERSEESLLPALSAKLKQYARRQKAWLRKLEQR